MIIDKNEIAKKCGKDPQDVIIGFTCSTFDLCHSGHIAMLAEARSQCDYLVVGLLSSPSDRPFKNSPVQSLFERFVQIQAVKYVDFIIPFESEKDLVDLLLTLLPDVRFCGKEYEGKDHTGVHLKNIKIIYNERQHSFSTSELRDRVILANNKT